MTSLKQKFFDLMLKYYKGSVLLDKLEETADQHAIEFVEWKDNNFLLYKDKTYYVKTSSKYFDVTKYIGKDKPTMYFSIKELLEKFKQEKGL
jgi:hypothetical protein